LFAVGTMPGAANQLMVNGTARTYVINQSPAPQRPQPTIIVLHDSKGTGAAIAQTTKLGTLAPQQGFVAVFPDGLRQQWNFFLPGKELEFYVKANKASGGVADDGAFLRALINDLVQRGIADAQRIFITGESNGGLMALRMLCTDANLFAGAALLATAMPETLGTDCHPSRPVPILMIKGTKDEVLPYAGGLIEPEETFRVWPNERLVKFFQGIDNQSGSPQTSYLPRKVPNLVKIDRWATCPGAPLTVYSVMDGPHIAPPDLNEGQVVLDFFSSPSAGNSCVASLPPGSSAGSGNGPGAGSGTGPAASAPGSNSAADPNAAQNNPAGSGANQSGSTPGAGNDPGQGTDTPGAPGAANGPTASDPNAPSGPAGGGPGDTAGLGPPADSSNPGNTAGLGPPPDSSNPGNTAGLGPPPDNGPQNPTGGLGPPPNPGGTTTALGPPPPYYPPLPPVYIPNPPGNPCHQTPPMPPTGNMCNPPPTPNVCNRRPPNQCNPQTPASNMPTNPAGTTTKPPGATTLAGLPPGNTTNPQPGLTGTGGGQSYCYGGSNGDQSCTSSFSQPYCFTQNGKQTCGTVSGNQTQTCSIANGKQNCSTQSMTSKFCASDGSCTSGLPPGYQPPTLFANNPATGAQASAPANPCNKSPAPLVLKPIPSTQLATPTPLPPLPNSGTLKLLPLPPASLPPSTASTSNVCKPKSSKTDTTHDSSPKKNKEAEKKPARNNNDAAKAAADAAAAAATATAIMGIVGAFGRHGGGGGGYGGGGHHNPCH
jgi:polyhydroxybutyrate depolymerase